MKRYLLFVSHSYSYSILRPLQDEIRRRGGEVAWYLENTCPNYLEENETQLKTVKEVIEYGAIASFAPGNHIYDFFPGIKVEIFHGLYYKRSDYGDHYKIRGSFDLYCTTSSMFTPHFKELEHQYGFFKVKETGWSKFDSFISSNSNSKTNVRPIILYAPTFTLSLNSTAALLNDIEKIIKKGETEWIFSFHPKMDVETISKYKGLAQQYENATFSESEDKLPLYKQSNLMISDNSSIIYEFLWFNKPAITYQNTFPDTHLINIENAEELEEAVTTALAQPKELMKAITDFMDIVHPFRDGKSAARILDATDDFIENYKGKLKKKPCNLFRKLKFRKKVNYWTLTSFISIFNR